MTPNLFLDFANRQLKYGRDEARRLYALENYTVAELVHLIKAEKLSDAVDLVSGGHVAVYVGGAEARKAKRDYAAAQAAGINLDGIEWLHQDTVQQVGSHSILINNCSHRNRRHTAPLTPDSDTQDTISGL